MITNINELQSSYSYGNYLKEYIDQNVSPLANAGQRFGINASGIKHIQVNIANIFNINEYNRDKYILELHGNNYSLTNIKLRNKETNTYEKINDINIDDDTKLTIQNIFNNDETLQNLIHFAFIDIEEVSKDSYINITNSLFTCFIKGKIIASDNNANNSILIYFQYDIESNTLLHYIVSKYYGKILSYDDWYIVYELNHKIDTNYELSIYLYRLEWLYNYICEDSIFNEETLNELLNNTHKFNNDNNGEYDLSFFNNNFIDYSLFRYIGPEITNISFLNYIFTYNYNSNTLDDIVYCYKFNNIQFNVENNVFTGVDILNDIFNNISSNDLIGYVSKEELDIFFINLQNVYNIYWQILLTYNLKTYFNTNNNSYIYKKIIQELFSYLKNEFNITDESDTLYIPLSYNFNCIVNDPDDIKLYYIDNFYIKFINNINNINKINQIYYEHTSLVTHTSIYNINIKYNEKSSNIITNVIVNKLYTLPYLNTLNNWVIDGEDTEYSTYTNKYSGIKELYIYNTLETNNINVKILNLTDNDIYKYFRSTTIKEFTINPKYFVNYSNITVNCKVKLPDLSNYNSSNDIIEFFKNTIIIAICNINILDKKYQDDYKLDYIYSLWQLNETYNESVQKYDFKLITITDGVTLDNDNIAYDPYNNASYIDTTPTYKFIQSLLISNQLNSNTSSIITDDVCMVMRNKNGLQYHNEYKNNYNAIIEYVTQNKIKENGNDPSYPETKYITNLSNTKTTNCIYPIYDIIFKYINKSVLKTTLERELGLKYKTYTSIIVNNKNVSYTELTSTATITKILQQVEKYVNETNIVEIGIQRFNNTESFINYYNEYVYNSNIPTIDLKETFIRNNNTLNRINILGVPNNDDTNNPIATYNGFIGTKYNDEDKSILYISTDNKNINIGNDTLLDISQSKNFNKYNTLQIDEFNNINLISSQNSSVKLNQNINVKTNVLNIDGNIFYNNNAILKNQINSYITTYSLSIIPQEIIEKYIYLTIRNNNIYGYINSQNKDLETQLLIPILGLYLTKNTNLNNLSELNNQINKNGSFKYFYNSLNLTKIENDIIQYIYNDMGIDISDYEINYKYNSCILELQYLNNKLSLLLFNDNSIENDIKFNNSIFEIFNHKLNISVSINTAYNKIDIYINFENNNIDTLNYININDSYYIPYTQEYYNSIGYWTNLDDNTIPSWTLDEIINKYQINLDNIDINELESILYEKYKDDLSIYELYNTFYNKTQSDTKYITINTTNLH